MTRTELETEAARLASMEGWTNSPTPPDWTKLVNAAWRLFSFDAELIIGTVGATAVAGQCEYRLTGIKRISWVSYNAIALEQSSEAFEQFLAPTWRTATGTPLRWVEVREQTIALSPVPNGTQAIVARGNVEGSDMSTGTDEPGQVGGTGIIIPKSLHLAIALQAALMQGQAFMQGQSSARMQYFDDEYAAYVLRGRGSVGQ